MKKDYSKILETVAKNNCQDAINSIAIEINDYPQIVDMKDSLEELKTSVNTICRVIGLISPYNVLEGVVKQNMTDDMRPTEEETERAART